MLAARAILKENGLEVNPRSFRAMLALANWSVQLNRLRHQLSTFRLSDATPWKEQCRRAGADAAAFKNQVNRLEKELTKVRQELADLRAERDRVASGKVVCADCNSILARF